MSSSRSEKMEHALQAVVQRVAANLASTPVPSFEHNHQEHPLTCAEECVFAGAQRLRKSAETILHEVQTENEYYLEKAAHLVYELSKANESLAQYTAELHQSYENPKTVYALLPHLELMVREGRHMFTVLKDTGVINTDTKNVK